jgi:hypothetical protein
MDTSTAAKLAKVSIDTIRTWCRRGVITAAKAGRRWTIDATSLARRIDLGKLYRKARSIVINTETLTAIGGSRWQKAGKDRVYFNNWAALAGLETDTYKSGNISSAAWQGTEISNSQAYKLGGTIDKLWFDTADGKFHCRYGFSESRVASREEVFEAAIAGIRSAVAAL